MDDCRVALSSVKDIAALGDQRQGILVEVTTLKIPRRVESCPSAFHHDVESALVGMPEPPASQELQGSSAELFRAPTTQGNHEHAGIEIRSVGSDLDIAPGEAQRGAGPWHDGVANGSHEAVANVGGPEFSKRPPYDHIRIEIEHAVDMIGKEIFDPEAEE